MSAGEKRHAAKRAEEQPGAWQRELHDIVRAAAGGMLFGIPLLYTMEVWWVGTISGPPQMLGLLAVSFVPVLLLNVSSGFRRVEASWWNWVTDSVIAVAVALVSTALVLALLRRITLGLPLDSIVGMVVFEAVPFALGAAVARQFLSGSREKGGGGEQGNQPQRRHFNPTVADLGATAAGAVFIASTIAPTEEIPMLYANMTGWSLAALVVFSLVVTYGIVFEADFASADTRRRERGLLQRPFPETIVAYVVALGVSTVMLLMFHNLHFNDPLHVWVGHAVLLGLPAAVGGAAGRLAV